MNKQWFTAAAWLKTRSPQASGGLMIPLCLLLSSLAKGTPLSSSPGCALAPNGASLWTNYSHNLALILGTQPWWMKESDARVSPWRRWACSLLLHDDVHLCVFVCDKLTYISAHSLLVHKLPSVNAPSAHTLSAISNVHIYIMLYCNKTTEYNPFSVLGEAPWHTMSLPTPSRQGSCLFRVCH